MPAVADKKSRTRQSILDAAQLVFLQRGFEAASPDDIAQRAGVSRATLFNYFSGKSGILNALAEGLQPRLVQLVDHYRGKPLSAAQRVEALFVYSSQVVAQTRDLTRLLLVHGSDGAELPLLRAALTELIVDGQDAGEVRRDFSALQLADMVYLSFVAGLLGWCETPGEDLADQFVQRARLLNANLLA
jgi:AcrR family transcriptional regulator